MNNSNENTLADKVGGTAIYKRDGQGQLFIEKATSNPGWHFESDTYNIAIVRDSFLKNDLPEQVKILENLARKWVNRGFVRMKGYSVSQFLLDNDAPANITGKTLQRFIKANKGKFKP